MDVRTEAEIMRRWNNIGEKPLVSISCTTYNHENFIEECINGFLIQNTSFPFEVLIYDDASTDGTPSIIRKYAKAYPNIIKPIFSADNLKSKGFKPMSSFNWDRAKGKYLAMCEGDDYWFDPNKIQKQVSFLEDNEEIIGCSHNTKIIYEEGMKGQAHLLIESSEKSIYGIKDFSSGRIYFHTSSMVYRDVILKNIPETYITDHYGDWFVLNAHATLGDIKYIDEVMSVYRIHKEGIWSKLSEEEKVIRNLNAIIKFNKIFKYEYENSYLPLFTRSALSLSKDKEFAFYTNKLLAEVEQQDLHRIIYYAYKDIEKKDLEIFNLIQKTTEAYKDIEKKDLEIFNLIQKTTEAYKDIEKKDLEIFKLNQKLNEVTFLQVREKFNGVLNWFFKRVSNFFK